MRIPTRGIFGLATRSAIVLAVTAFSSIAVAVERANFQPYRSDVLRGGQAAEHVRLDVAGLEEIWLIAIGVPNNGKGYADWGDARLIDKAGNVTYLSDLEPTADRRTYGGIFRDKRQHGGGPLCIAGREFRRGIGTHADCEICYRLDGNYKWFEAWIGIDAHTGQQGHVRFEVSNKPRGLVPSTSSGRGHGSTVYLDPTDTRPTASSNESPVTERRLSRLSPIN